jgi:hypothetical protein
MNVNMQQHQQALNLSTDARYVLDKLVMSDEFKNNPSAAINMCLITYGIAHFDTSEESSDEIISK